MNSVHYQLQQLLKSSLTTAFPTLNVSVSVEVVPCIQEKFGHYQCSTPLKLAKSLSLAPREIAQQWIEALPSTPLIETVRIDGPGFINIHLTPAFLSQRVYMAAQDPRLAIQPVKKPQKILIDFSSPNIAKEMHVGHLRSTIIGDALARLFTFLGHEVTRINHIGDWGTAFGMLIAYILDQQLLDTLSQASLPELMRWYRQAKQRFDEDPLFKKNAQLQVVALQAHEPTALTIWETICAISRRAYQEIYDLLGISLQERGESFYNPFLSLLVVDLQKKGLVSDSDGALCMFIDGFYNREGDALPFMIQKSDGGYTYDTTDLAALRYRVEEERMDRILYVTDQGQNSHFMMLFQAAQKAGYVQLEKTRLDHVGFGLVLGADGKKFRTRSGETEKLIDLLHKAIDTAYSLLKERSSAPMAEEELHKTAQILGLAAVKYADLSVNRMSDYSFSYEKMLKFEGNTAAFILYSYVRVGGIRRKLGSISSKAKVQLEHPSEISLGLHLARFAEVLEEMSDSLLPNRLTDYLYGLAEKFNAFFRDCRVEGSEQQESRWLICQATARTLHKGLELLGIQTVERM